MLAACLTITTQQVYAYNTFNQHKLKYGVSGQHYWIDSSAAGYTTTIQTAMNEWIYTTSYWGVTTPISYTKATTKSESRMDIYGTNLSTDWYAITSMYDGSGTLINPNNTDWVWGMIRYSDSYPGLSSDKKKAVMAHEMGHVMGLAHTSYTQAVMRPDIGYCTDAIYRAQPNDLAGINVLYN